MKLSRSAFPRQVFCSGRHRCLPDEKGPLSAAQVRPIGDHLRQRPGNCSCAQGKTGAIACDHYHRMGRRSGTLLKDRSMDAYAFPPAGAGAARKGRQVGTKRASFYDRLVDGCLDRGIKAAKRCITGKMPLLLADFGRL